MTGNPESTDKMEIIIHSLQADPTVVLAGAVEFNSLQKRQIPVLARWQHIIDLYVHPAEPIYTADELNAFQRSLEFEETVEPLKYKKFNEVRFGAELLLGEISCEQVIGREASGVMVDLKTESLLVRQGAFNHWWCPTEEIRDLRARTCIRIFPDAGHLADAFLDERNRHSIPIDKLSKSTQDRELLHALDTPTVAFVLNQMIQDR